MNCYICNFSSFVKVQGTVRDIPNLGILKCNSCGLIRLENFDHITDDYYESSQMTAGTSIENWRLETIIDDVRRAESFLDDIEKKDILDFGAGNGQFLKLCQSVASSITGIELNANSRLHLESEGIFCFRTLEDLPKDRYFDTITAFHVIEHLKDPVYFLKNISKKLKKNGKIILELPNANDALLSLYNCKQFSEFTYWGCHLMLFDEDTIKRVLDMSKLKCLKIKQIQRYPISNHLYWLSKNLPGGHNVWNFLNTKDLKNSYESSLAKIGACDTIVVEATL